MVALLLSEENVRMQYEIVIMLLLLLVPAIKLKDRKKLGAAWGAVFLFFIYIHRALLPFLISGIYFFALAGIVWAAVRLDIKKAAEPALAFKSRLLRLLDKKVLPCTMVVIIILLIQLCRINISMDYDSLRYGLRSDVLLSDSGIRGFFEGIGLVNGVYSYPKGFELITLPLFFGHTYGYVLCFNIWVLIAVIMLSGEITSALSGDEKHGRGFGMGAMLISLVPGITNMSVTAKSDLTTLMCQLLFILCVVKYHTNSRNRLLPGLGAGALILSYALKPTSLIFSSLLGLTAIIYFICKRERLGINKNGIIALLLSACFTAIITIRTQCIAGMPFTSIFSGLFSRLGFKLKYPLAEQLISGGYGEGTGLTERIQAYLSRLLHFIFCPVGDDMKHVIMAWGGLVFVVMLSAAVIMYKRTLENAEGTELLIGAQKIMTSGENGTEKKSADGQPDLRGAVSFMYAELAAAAVMSLISLALLYQIDGNYYQLFYALSVTAGAAAVTLQLGLEESRLNRNKRTLLGGSSGLGVIALSAVMIYFTAFTGWSGAVGFTPIDLINRGYYNHEAEYGLKNPLSWDKHTRVVAFAGEPDCYKLCGRVESLVDICGSLGNVYLVKSLNIFKEYLDLADIDYIYADISYLDNDEDGTIMRAGELFKDLTADGCFEEMVYEENSSTLLYCRIDKERVKHDWEEPMSAEQADRAAAQQELLSESLR